MAISNDIIETIINLYSQNISISTISKKINISKYHITKILKSANIEIKKCNYQKLNIDINAINKLYYEDKKSTYDIAKLYGCSDETIRKLVVVRPIAERNILSEESIAKIAIKSKLLWQNEEYIKKVKNGTSTKEYKEKLRNDGIKNYDMSLGKWMKSAESKLIISTLAKKNWNNPEYRAKQEVWYSERITRISAAAKEALNDPIRREKWINKLRKSSAANRLSNGWVSTPQKQLYYILTVSDITFNEEGPDTIISPFYTVDCVIPKQQKMHRPLIIEVQGEYWHNLPHVIIKDKQKETYIRNHTDYDLLKLDELELSSFNQIQGKLNEYGLIITSINCATSDLIIERISEEDAKMFYSIFHYTGTIRKGAIAFGAYYNKELICAISYTYPMRIETAQKLNCQIHEIMEISRLARKTNVICKNLISFMIGNTRKKLQNIVKLVSFSDSTYGHTGKVYAASGFKFDGLTSDDYHYISLYGKYHKKTIWDRSKRMKMTEDEYAEKHGLIKIKTSPKSRWVYDM
jgi:hypothetical protein